MPLELGAAFASRQQIVLEPELPATTVDDLRAEQLLVALEALREALLNLPAPVVNVSEPDLTAIVQAVTQLKGPATAEEIATAVVSQISPGGEPGMDTVLSELTAALKKLDFRLTGLNAGGGGGGPSTVNLAEATIQALTTGGDSLTDAELRAAPVKTDDDESQVLLTSIRDEQVRRSDTVTTTSTVAVAAAQQDRAWLAGTGRVTLNVAGNLRIVIQNTSTTMPVLLLRLAGLASATGWAQVLRNPTTGVPTAPPRPNQNARLGNNITVTTPIEIRVDTSATTALSGGTDTGLVLGIPGGSRASIDLLPLRLDPQQSVGINVPFTGAADAAMSVYWMNAL